MKRKAMFRVYIRLDNGEPMAGSQIFTTDLVIATNAFSDIVHDSKYDGSQVSAVMSYSNSLAPDHSKLLAMHNFSKKDGDEDFLRNKLAKTAVEKRKVGRPASLSRGKNINTYLDAESVAIAALIGVGNVSEGVRRALKSYSLHSSYNTKGTICNLEKKQHRFPPPHPQKK